MSDNPILCDDGRRPDWQVGFAGVDDIYAGVNEKAEVFNVAFVLIRETTEDEFVQYWTELRGPRWKVTYTQYIAAYPAQRRYFEAVMD